jgi:nitrite reductase (NADH) small subunit
MTLHFDLTSVVEDAPEQRSGGQSREGWVEVCRYDDLQPERGVAALVEGHQVALFRTFDGMLHAVDNLDPYSGAFVLSRGIVGSRGAVPTVASPIFKQVFDLRTGTCLTDPAVSVTTHDVRCVDGAVHVRLTGARHG